MERRTGCYYRIVLVAALCPVGYGQFPFVWSEYLREPTGYCAHWWLRNEATGSVTHTARSLPGLLESAHGVAHRVENWDDAKYLTLVPGRFGGVSAVDIRAHIAAELTRALHALKNHGKQPKQLPGKCRGREWLLNAGWRTA